MTEVKKDKILELKGKIFLQEIVLLENHINYISETNEPITKLHFGSSMEFKVHEEQDLLVSTIKNSVQTQEKRIDLATIGIACIFKITNIKEFLEEKEDGTHINEELLDTLSKITASTSRGIMFEKLRGTYLHKAILPLLPIDFPSHMVPDKKPKQQKKQG